MSFWTAFSSSFLKAMTDRHSLRHLDPSFRAASVAA
jgi:hypothetical protein